LEQSLDYQQLTPKVRMADKMQRNIEPSSTSSTTHALVPMQDKEASCEMNEIRVNAEIFKSLLATVNDLSSSVDGLRDSISKLQSENAGLKQEPSTLQKNCGGTFILFPKLSVELRR
jgi:hypothetical protein